jgi:hypothetical protein
MSQSSISSVFWSAVRTGGHQHLAAAKTTGGCGCGAAEDKTAGTAATSSSCCGPTVTTPADSPEEVRV